MKRRLFKPFKTIDFNTYYHANIHGNTYYAVGTSYRYVEKWGFLKVPRVEEESFMSVKIPLVILLYLTDIQRKGTESNLAEIREDTREKLMGNSVTAEEEMLNAYPERTNDIRKEFSKHFESINAMFYQDWDNSIVSEYLNKGWTFMYQQYAGRATRDVWLGRRYDDLTTIIQLKLFGSAKDNEVVDTKRVMMDLQTLSEFVAQVAGDNGTKEHK